jgi:transcriptional regulator with XRE-family HTH domain
MDNEKMGQFISEQRKSLQMTQRELAAKLNISDKAVSKWERGLSCPDISLLSPLSNILGVTTTELLNGERAGSEAVNVETVVVNALEYGEKAGKRKIELNLNIIAAAYSVLLLIGIFVVSVVDVAISHGFTWSLIPIVACVFAWIVFIPAIKFGVKGIVGSLAAITVFIIPFLFALDYAIGRFLGSDTMLFPIGLRIAPFAAAFAWIAYLLLRKFKTRKLLVIAILVLLASPISYFTNSLTRNMLNEPYDGIDFILNTISPVIAAAILFVIEFVIRKSSAGDSDGI